MLEMNIGMRDIYHTRQMIMTLDSRQNRPDYEEDCRDAFLIVL